MCVLFFITNPNPQVDGYRLILVNNRDEFYTRPTKEANFWENNQDNIGGLDMEPGKEGGTWLGMNKSGKIGVLLNVLQPVGAEGKDKLGRGSLVPDFLNGTDRGINYLQKIYAKAHSFSMFNMVTIELSPKVMKDVSIAYYTNNLRSPPAELRLGEHAFGNSEPEKPWKKLVYGRKKFGEIVNRHKSTTTKGELINQLLEMLDDDTTFHPDNQIAIQGAGRGEEVVERLSALYVRIPSIQYGTRTHTIILIDTKNQVTYIERTMKEPINHNYPEWITSTFNFGLKD